MQNNDYSWHYRNNDILAVPFLTWENSKIQMMKRPCQPVILAAPFLTWKNLKIQVTKI
jgi:hypothetical protein